ncbi:hypothetical protein B0T21DRAFT_362465 [Apiosordaria backusii]|uniref:Uncharacterized protein n=1 Tax=Apiosordaria backusii TaxID=314023 RepID=A0AA40BS22_9PEZI|nr:hypothetical protein B0T21DRAFT_362465 [Apiosordaria backusii]
MMTLPSPRALRYLILGSLSQSTRQHQLPHLNFCETSCRHGFPVIGGLNTRQRETSPGLTRERVSSSPSQHAWFSFNYDHGIESRPCQ